MRKSFRIMSLAVSAMAFTGVIGFSATVTAAEKKVDEHAAAKKIVYDRNRGNCIACHMMDNGEQPGNIAPPLIAMKARFPDKAVLRAQIADSRDKNPDSMMPPFGPHSIMSPEEIDIVLEYVYSL